jgi:type IV secretory pathway TraG/TraD family ATPase VirD4
MSSDNSTSSSEDWIWSSGKDSNNPRKDNDSDLDPRIIKYGGLVVGLIFLPLLFLVYVSTVFSWKKLQYNSRWLYLASLVMLLGGLIFGLFSASGVDSFASALENMFTGPGDFGDNFLNGIPGLLWAQIPYALVLGTLAASGRVFMLKRQAKKNKKAKGLDYIEPSVLAKRRGKKTAEEISQGINSPASGSTVGIARDTRDPNGALGEPGEEYGKRVVLSRDELSAHAFVVGGSGSGKTQTMLAMARDSIRQGNGLVFVDCKGGPDVAEKIAEYAERYGRTFHHWTIQDPNQRYTGPSPDGPSYYDPIARGDASRRKDLLIGSMKWDMEYYRSVISNFLQTLFRVKDLVPPARPTDTLTDVTDLLNHNALIHRARYIDPQDHAELVSTLTRFNDADDTERSGIRSMYMRLHTIITSVAGHWMRMDPEGKKDIDLRKVADEGEVVVFSLDTSNYEETAELIAGLIVQDLKTLSSELRLDPAERPLQVFIDEFSAVDATNVLGLLNKARDAKVSCVLATQALADLARSVPTFKEQVLNIVSTFIFHRTNTMEDAEVYAGLSGVDKQTRVMTSMDGRAYEYEHEATVVSRGEFQKLKQGEAIVVIKSPKLRYINYVEVIPENPNFPSSDRDPALPGPSGTRRATVSEPRKTYPHPEIVRLQKEKAKKPNQLDVPDTASAGERQAEYKRPARSVEPQERIETSAFDALPDSEIPLPTPPSSVKGKPAGAPMPNVGKKSDEDKSE